MDYQKRRQRVQSKVAPAKHNAYLITDFYNILYLTGFKTLSPHEKEAKLLITPDLVYFITDTRYESEAHSYFHDDDVRVLIHGQERPLLQLLTDLVTRHDLQKLGFEKHDLSYAWFEHLKKALPNVELQPISNEVMHLRNVKDEHELRLMRKAAKYADECLYEIVTYLKPGVHESEIIDRMEDWIRKKKLEFSFEPIVAFDKHTALPHYNNKTSDAVLRKNSIILMDIGITYQDYCSDITRMFFTGKPSQEQKQTYKELLEIQNATILTLQKEAKVANIDTFAREKLIKKGHPSIPHSTGHGVGLEVHEGIRIARTVSDTLVDNAVITIEPGIYYEGKWGMRIEDTVAFVDGNVELLTKSPKNLTLL